MNSPKDDENNIKIKTEDEGSIISMSEFAYF